MWRLLLLCQRLRAVDLDLDLGAEEKAVCSSMQVSFAPTDRAMAVA